MLAGDRARQPAEIFKRIGGRGRVSHERFLDRLAGVERLDAAEFLIALAQDLRACATGSARARRL
jgi:hypothetical protein